MFPCREYLYAYVVPLGALAIFGSMQDRRRIRLSLFEGIYGNVASCFSALADKIQNHAEIPRFNTHHRRDGGGLQQPASLDAKPLGRGHPNGRGLYWTGGLFDDMCELSTDAPIDFEEILDERVDPRAFQVKKIRGACVIEKPGSEPSLPESQSRSSESKSPT